jgi:hypothetical protein
MKMPYERHRGKLRFLGDDYTYWTWAEGKEASYFNFVHKLSKETGFGYNTLINAVPISMWKIHVVPAKRTMDQQILLNKMGFDNIGKSEKTAMKWKEVSTSVTIVSLNALQEIPKETNYITDKNGRVFKVEYLMTVGVNDNEKDNRVDDRCTRLQSCLDEIIKVAQRARG